MDNQTEEKTWRTAEGLVIPIARLGDQHLVNILAMIESNAAGKTIIMSGTLPQTQLEQYDDLVLEAISRGLFSWHPERKHLTPITAQIVARRAQNRISLTAKSDLYGGIAFDLPNRPVLSASSPPSIYNPILSYNK